MRQIDRILEKLSEAPADQINPIIATEIKALMTKPEETILRELKGIATRCKRQSLASAFALQLITGAIGSVEIDIQEK